MSEIKLYNHVFRLVLSGLLLGWFIKLKVFFWNYLNVITFKYPVSFSQFPALFESPATAQLMYFLPVMTLPAVFLKGENISIIYHKICCICLIFASLFMMLHSATYNDATFVTSFWVSLWLLWFTFHFESKYYKDACKLAMAVVCFIFLGGLTGKLSSEWWSGEVMFGITQSTFKHWPFTWIKNNTTYEELKTFSMVLSWGIIFLEAAIVSSFFWPLRFSLKIIPALIAGIIFFRTWLILSVISCLILLLTGCYLLYKNIPADRNGETD